MAYKKTGDLEASQEMVQDIFVGLYKQVSSLHAHTILENYLFIALRNRVFNYHRQLLVQWKKEQTLRDGLVVNIPENDQRLELKELEASLQAKIQLLPPQCRTVFLLSRQENLSNKEVAERLNISVNTVEQHMRKALRILRTSLGDELALLLIWTMLKS